VHKQKTWQAILDDDGEDAAIKWIRDARFRRDKNLMTATELGSLVHDACEQYALTGQRPLGIDPEVEPFLDQFDGWLNKFQPEYTAAELTVYSPSYGYAGTADAFMTVGGMRVIADYKSSRKSHDAQGRETSPYPEVGLQLAAYRWAECAAAFRARRYEKWRRRYYLLSADERAMAVPVPDVDGGIVIHITPTHCVAYPVLCDETVHTAFLYILEAARWQFDLSSRVIGPPLEV